MRQDADRMMAVVAAETQKRSEKSTRGVGFARGHGHRNAPGMVEKQTGVSGPEAKRLIELGETLADAERAAAVDQNSQNAGEAPRDACKTPAMPPEVQPAGPVFAHVAAASRAGQLGAEGATAITRMLRGVADRADAELMVEAEKDLVSKARFMSLYRLGQVINRWRDRLDADHLEELAQERRDRRFLNVGENADGMIRINGQLDPENGAPWVALMGAMVNQQFRSNKSARDAIKKGLVATVDDRTPGQVCADAMGAFARHLQGCDVEVLPHTSAKVVVTMDYDTMLAAAKGDSTLGATIEGLSTTPDAGELRRMMARAGLIPSVLGKGSRKLDVGYTGRPFNPAQRIAILKRDGGCAKCSLPAAWDDCHHITPLEFGGKTETTNGVTLCVKCHHDVHREGWIIVATETEVWFIPPAHLDPERTPQPGGRKLFDATAVYGDHLPDPADVIARTPIAAAKAGDHRRRQQPPPAERPRSIPPEQPTSADRHDEPPTPRPSGTSACAMAPDSSISTLVEPLPDAASSGSSPHDRESWVARRIAANTRARADHVNLPPHRTPRDHRRWRRHEVPAGLVLGESVFTHPPPRRE
ncbi:HNH endonuclease signature motif containing protein [Demequina sp. NBRC 110051]|uniref:HNH endonuclease n=1 Tax=Demequina sp. NBRC 110051 TaxID=1570340 RepID=UPI00135672BC|nr:HNH endonuclease signature motif containing protein [Demequina sp. NBRC 110051]